MLLAGDVGGTKTNLAIFSIEAGPSVPLVETTLASACYPSMEALMAEFLSQVDVKVEQASLGVAGPVLAGRATITNLPWVIEAEHLRKTLNLSSVQLLNDLEAIAWAIPCLKPDDLYTLNKGEVSPGGAMAVIAPGTGLGESFLTWDGARYWAHVSEGGHAGFAPANQVEEDLLHFLRKRFGHVSCERVCSGRGLPNIYNFLKESGRATEPAWLAERLSSAVDPTPIIVQAALDTERRSELCTATLDIFISTLGTEAGNLALKVLATGGVYIGGGMPLHILPVLKSGRFMEAFNSKGRMSDILLRVPVHIILNPKIALFGAACYALNTT